MTMAERLADRYFALKAIRDSAEPSSQQNLKARKKMIQVIDKAGERGVGCEFLARLVEVCPQPTKVAYADRGSAAEHGLVRTDCLRELGDKSKELRPYMCSCGYWHLTSYRHRATEGETNE